MNQSRPNVLFIYPDQMRYDCMSNAGNPVLKTPGFDRLNEEGVNFRAAYTSMPLCCPFRASIMTGKYATSHGMMANHYPIALEQEFLPQIMRDNGYNTAWVGKWHLNGGRKYDYVPEEYRLGFEHFIGFSRGHAYTTPVYYRNNDTTPYKSRLYEPDMQTQHLLDFVRDSIDEGRPFFAGIGYGLPHPPLNLAPDYIRNLFSPGEVPLRGNVPANMEEEACSFLSRYYGLVSNVDYQIQTVLCTLDHLGVLDNTMVIVASDHGEMACEHGVGGKKVFYESAMHVPFLIRYPKFQPREITGQIVDPSVDIMPTILEVCAIDIPAAVEGHSLKTLLETGADASLPDHVLYQIPREADGPERHPYAHRGIRTKSHLYVEVESQPAFLFDLENDPNEMVNLVCNSRHYELVAELHNKLCAEMERIGDSWEKEMHFPPPGFQTHELGSKFNSQLYERAVLE